MPAGHGALKTRSYHSTIISDHLISRATLSHFCGVERAVADKAPSVPRFSSVSRLHQPRSSGRSARQLYGGCADRPVACLHGDPSSSQPIGSDRFAADDSAPLADFARDDPPCRTPPHIDRPISLRQHSVGPISEVGVSLSIHISNARSLFIDFIYEYQCTQYIYIQRRRAPSVHNS